MDNNTKHYTEKPKTSSDRSFGLVFFGFFLIVAMLPLAQGQHVRLWAIGVGLGFGGIAVLAPAILAPLNRLWTKFGELLHRFISPITLGVLFFGVVTPTALLLRILRKDPLRLKFDSNALTYWIERTPPGPKADTFKQQF